MDYVLPTSYIAGSVLLIGSQYADLIKLRHKLLPHFFYRIFDEPQQALECLTQRYFSHRYQQPWINSNSNANSKVTDAKTHGIYIDISKLSSELSSSHRFEEVLIVLVDATQMSNCPIAFCSQLASLKTKKLLLIHAKDLSKVKEALKEGIIDGYIIKEDVASVYIKLTTAIATLAYNYFQESALPIVKSLETQNPQLSDMTFIDFFQTLCFDKNIVEFYLIDTSGGYLLLDGQAKPSYLSMSVDTSSSTLLSSKNRYTIYGNQVYTCQCYDNYDDMEQLPKGLYSEEWVAFSTFCASAIEFL